MSTRGPKHLRHILYISGRKPNVSHHSSYHIATFSLSKHHFQWKKKLEQAYLLNRNREMQKCLPADSSTSDATPACSKRIESLSLFIQ